jgi:SAM-dependent methyltransferase
MDSSHETNQIFQALQGISSQPLEKKIACYSSVADDYDATRPDYPRQLIDQVLDYCRISSESKLLEIGSGPATATVAFAETGCRLKCLDPNPEFCAIARRKLLPYPRVAVSCCSLEDSRLQPGSFDAVLAANSMHWVSPEIGFQKVASALKAGGFLINLWNKEMFPLAPMRDRLVAIYQAHDVPVQAYQDPDLQHCYLTALGALMVRSGYFRLAATCTTEVFCDYTADQYIALLSTFAAYISLDAGLRANLFAAIRRCINDAGSTIPLSYLSAFHIGVKISDQVEFGRSG